MAKLTGFDYLKAFDDAAEQVFAEVLGEAPARGSPITQIGASIPLHEVNVSVGLAGTLAGYIRLGMDEDSARAIAAAMLGEDVPELDEMSLSALSELGNMIAGCARSALNGSGEVSDITPPSIVRGQGGSETWFQLRTVSLPLKLSMGTVHLGVGIRPSTPKEPLS